MTSIICGSCKRTHSSVQDVKYCYSMGTGAIRLNELFDRRAARAATPATLPARCETFIVADSGIYFVDGIVYKVYANQAGTAMLAKSLTKTTGEWQYEGAAYRFVKKHQRITQAQAKEYGAIYGVCAICGRTLTDEKSIAAGIGPVCAGKQGW